MQKGQTFSEQVKENLANVYPKKKCCRRALASAMYLCSRTFAQNGTLGDAEYLQTMLSKLRTTVDLAEIGAIFTRELPIEDVFVCEECINAFFKGVFLSCGSVNDPGYSGSHLEISLSLPQVFDLIGEAFEMSIFSPKVSHRHQQSYAFYFKKNEEIEDFLTYIGAQNDAFLFMNTKIEKEKSSLANRLTNCDTANIQKTVRSAAQQMDAISYLEKCGVLSHLPTPLQETAKVRKANPDASLPELVLLHDGQVSKSGVNHRLQKLIQLAEKEKGKEL